MKKLVSFGLSLAGIVLAATAVSSCGASYAAAGVNVKKSGGQAVT